MKYRSRLAISVIILESARTGIPKTKLMYKGYLSYTQLVTYLKYLHQNNLLAYEKDTQLYRLTEKGSKFLDKSYELNELMGQAMAGVV